MKTNKYPLVSIIIANWNGGKVFEDCLESLSKLKYPNWELVVVDNGSTDRSFDFPKEFKSPISNYKLVRNKINVGFAPANNQGVKKAKGDYILLLNNDTKVTPNFLTILVEKIESDLTIGVIQPKIFMMDPPSHKASEGRSEIRYLDNAGSFMTRIGFLEHWGFGQKDGKEFNKEREVFSCKGACMLIRKEIIDKIGLFDEAFKSYFEESDFCWRVWIAGWKVLYFPKAHIYHKVGFTIQRMDVTKVNFDYYKNRIASLVKNLSFINLIVMLPLHLFFSYGISFLFFVRGQFTASFMIVKALWWNTVHFPQVLAKRSEVQKSRKVSDKDIFSDLMVRVNIAKFFGDFKRVEKDMK